MVWRIQGSKPGRGKKFGGCFSGIKRPGLKAVHSPPYLAEVKNKWSYTSPLSVWLYNVHTDSFIFLVLWLETVN
jgi:hypothetical protein